jgi:hypothetical protein
MNHETPLSQTHPRSEQIALAFDHADDAVKESYREFAVRFAYTVKDFTGEDVTTAFKADPTTVKPAPRDDHNEWKFAGGVIQKLVASGVFEKTGEWRNRYNGNGTRVYRLRIGHG